MARVVLNRALVLETADQLPDGAGGYAQTWRAMGTLWAAVEPRSGREREKEAVGTAKVDYRITVRALPQGSAARPQSGQRFRDGTRVFRIMAVADRGTDGRYLTCFSTEEVAA
jgi:head-tail adaptor